MVDRRWNGRVTWVSWGVFISYKNPSWWWDDHSPYTSIYHILTMGHMGHLYPVKSLCLLALDLFLLWMVCQTRGCATDNHHHWTKIGILATNCMCIINLRVSENRKAAAIGLNCMEPKNGAMGHQSMSTRFKKHPRLVRIPMTGMDAMPPYHAYKLIYNLTMARMVAHPILI